MNNFRCSTFTTTGVPGIDETQARIQDLNPENMAFDKKATTTKMLVRGTMEKLYKTASIVNSSHDSGSIAEFQTKSRSLVESEQLWKQFRSELEANQITTAAGVQAMLQKFLAENISTDNADVSRGSGDNVNRKPYFNANNQAIFEKSSNESLWTIRHPQRETYRIIIRGEIDDESCCGDSTSKQTSRNRRAIIRPRSMLDSAEENLSPSQKRQNFFGWVGFGPNNNKNSSQNQAQVSHDPSKQAARRTSASDVSSNSTYYGTQKENSPLSLKTGSKTNQNKDPDALDLLHAILDDNASSLIEKFGDSQENDAAESTNDSESVTCSSQPQHPETVVVPVKTINRQPLRRARTKGRVHPESKTNCSKKRTEKNPLASSFTSIGTITTQGSTLLVEWGDSDDESNYCGDVIREKLDPLNESSESGVYLHWPDTEETSENTEDKQDVQKNIVFDISPFLRRFRFSGVNNDQEEAVSSKVSDIPSA